MIDRTLNKPDFRRADGGACGWAVSPGLTPYPEAAAAMEARAEAIARGEASELVWLLEHPPLYTAGVSARDSDLLDAVCIHEDGQQVGHHHRLGLLLG